MQTHCFYNNWSISCINRHYWSHLVIIFIPHTYYVSYDPWSDSHDESETERICCGIFLCRVSSCWVAHYCWNLMKNANTHSLQKEVLSSEGWSQKCKTVRKRKGRAIFSMKASKEWRSNILVFPMASVETPFVGVARIMYECEIYDWFKREHKHRYTPWCNVFL